MEHIHPLQALLLALLAAMAAVAVLAKRLSLSYPILLVLVGLGCSLLPHAPRIPLAPDTVLYVFLPPLLYAAAWQTSWREFKYQLVSISLLAVGLVFFTAVGVALLAHFFLPGFDWRLGFLLGAVVSPTDAVAASSIAKKINMPRPIVDLLEGESLVNDATGLLALQFGLDLLDGGATPSVSRAALELLWLVGGGVGVGLLVGWVVARIERWVEEGPVEIAFSLIVAYAAYLLGGAVHASGVIAVVVCGLYLSRKAGSLFSPQSRLQILGAWDALEFLLNGLVFLLLGLQLPYVLEEIHGYSRLRLGVSGLVFSAVLIALRLIWMYPGASMGFLIRNKMMHQTYRMPSRRGIFAVGWTGMRGVVSFAAAASLPYTMANGQALPERGVIVFLTFAVILVTVVLQGLTLPAVVRGLAFAEDGKLEEEEAAARRTLLEAAIAVVAARDREATDGASREESPYRGLLQHLQTRMQQIEAGQGPAAETSSLRTVWLDIYQQQRSALDQLRSTGRIGDGVFWTLERELDLGESRTVSQK